MTPEVERGAAVARPRVPAIPVDRLADGPDVQNVVELLRHAAADSPSSEFLRFSDGSWTFGEVDAWTSQLAHYLRDVHGVQPGDRVAIMLPNVVHWPIAWLGTLKVGAAAVPVNFSYQASDLDFVLRDSGAIVVLTTPEKVELVRSVVAAGDVARAVVVDVTSLDLADRTTTRPEVDIHSETLANLQYTSGTTGFPKACMLTHDYWTRLAWINGGVAAVDRTDVLLTAQPFSYMDPQWNAVVCMMARTPLVVLPKFSASGFFADVRRHKVTVFYVLGTMPTLLHKQPPHPDDLGNDLRLVLCSGIPPALHAELEKRWGAPWREGYGMTESGVDLIAYPEDTSLVGSGLMGRPVPGKTVRVVDEHGDDVADGATGQLLSAGRPMMLGYWNRPDETAATLRDGWLHTGDLVQRTPDGYFRLVGRLKDMVRRGGENVSCAEVEGALWSSDEVAGCAVVAVPDELFGEEVKAFVELAEGVSPDRETAERLADHARARLARFKVPRYVEFVTEFPRTPSERIAKAALKELPTLTPGRTYDVQRQRT
jgi:acyl-CoA synthetase (AMP-forming)/AMP-acid ligase II